MQESESNKQKHRSKLKNSIPIGTIDVFGQEMERRQYVLDVIRNVYELFGFEPLHTPVIEHAVVFDGHHGEGEKLLFNLEDNRGTKLVLRYDLTVPLARVISMYPQLPRPFKRYQQAVVFRDDEVDRGHFREFIQCDGDIVGVSSLTADADIITLAFTGLTKLGFSEFTIRVNHRKIIKGIAEKSGVTNREGILDVQRALDFVDKITKDGLSGVRADLERRGINPTIINNILSVIELCGSPFDVLDQLEDILSNQEQAREGIAELREIFSYLQPRVINSLSVDLALARGADYYTGFILEGVIEKVPVGAVLGGGRYDNLVTAFGAFSEPAVGMTFGLERILTIMRELTRFETPDNQRVLVASVRYKSVDQAFRVVQLLRSANIKADFCCIFKDEKDMFKHAEIRNFSIVVIFNERGNFSLREIKKNPNLIRKVMKILNR